MGMRGKDKERTGGRAQKKRKRSRNKFEKKKK